MFPGETILSSPDPLAGVDKHVSEFKVLRSGAGWYIGTIWTSCDCQRCQDAGERPGDQEPNTRETGYFETEEKATAALAHFVRTGQLEGQRQDTAHLFSPASSEAP